MHVSAHCSLRRSMGEPMPLGTEDVYTGISELHRERGDLEAAAQDLLTSKKLGEQVELPDWQYRWCIAQARLQETLGDLDGALDLLDEAERLYVRTPLPDVRPIAARRHGFGLRRAGWPKPWTGRVSGAYPLTTTSATCASSSTSPWPGCSSPDTRATG